MHYQLILHHAFISIKIIFNMYPNYTEMIYNQEKRYVSHDLESMIQDFFGYSIPLNDIHNLILGVPQNVFNIKYDHHGNLKSAKYMNSKEIWEIQYTEYYNTPIVFPKKIKLCHKKDFINIKIYRWIY